MIPQSCRGAAALLALVLWVPTLTGCATEPAPRENTSAGNQFESDNPGDSTFTDDAGNEMQVGQDLDLPADWPSSISPPQGRLVAVSVVNPLTAVATWQVDGDVMAAETLYLELLESNGFTVENSSELSTNTISVFFARDETFDVTVSATPGDKVTDPGEITVVVNPAL